MQSNVTKNNEQIEQDQDIEAVIKEITLPRLDEYLKNREKNEMAWNVRAAKILGIDFHLPALAFMEILSISLIIIASMINLFLIKDTDILNNYMDEYIILGLTNNIYLNLLYILPWMFFIALGYNFIENVPTIISKKRIRFFKVVYGFLIILTFFFMLININLTYGSRVGFAWSMLIVLGAPIFFGGLAIFVKHRFYIYLSLFAVVLTNLFYKNDFDDLLYIILFATFVLLFIEIGESSIKFSKVYSTLQPERDINDYDLFNNTVFRYFIGLISFIGLTVIFSYMIFNSQVIFSIVMPDEIVNSLEFRSPIFLFIPLILFAMFLFFLKWLLKYGPSLMSIFPAPKRNNKKAISKNN